jgi:hypothetical protein
VESSCEFGIEPSGSKNAGKLYRVTKQLGISRVVLSSMELVSYDNEIRQICDKILLA